MTEKEARSKFLNKGLSSAEIDKIIKECCKDSCNSKCIEQKLKSLVSITRDVNNDFSDM